MKRALISTVLAALLMAGGIMPAGAWDRGDTEIFAILPHLPGGAVPSEGLTVGPDGTVYTPTFGINSQGAVPGPPHLFSFNPTASCSTMLRWSIPGTPSPVPFCSDGISEIFPDSADLRPFQRHCLAGRSEDGQSDRVHEHRTGS
jgi:hypothetical protein